MQKSSPTNLMLITGHISFFVLIALSVIFANERVIYIDSAAQLFEMIQRDGFAVYDHRMTMLITQSLPLLFIWMGAGLQSVIIAYSVAAPLLAYLVFLVIAYILKDVRLGLLLLLPLLCMRCTFYHAISETFSLIIYATLLLALIRYHTPEKGLIAFIYYLSVALCTLCCVFMHPIGMFFVLFLLGYHFVDCQMKPSKVFILIAVTLLVSATVKLFLTSGHDAGYMPTWQDIIYCFHHPGDLKIISRFFTRIIDFYIYPIALYAIVLVWHIRHKQWWRMAFGILFNICFFGMSVIVYRREGGAVGVERAFLPLMFFAAIPFLCEVLPHIDVRRNHLFLIIFVAALTFAFAKIIDTSKHYRSRLAKLNEVSTVALEMGQHKLVADVTSIDNVFHPTWCNSFETMLLSALQGPDRTVTFYVEDEPIQLDNPNYQDSTSFIAVSWWRMWLYKTLRPQYFILPQQPYQQLLFVDGKPIIRPIPSIIQTTQSYSDAEDVNKPNTQLSNVQ